MRCVVIGVWCGSFGVGWLVWPAGGGRGGEAWYG